MNLSIVYTLIFSISSLFSSNKLPKIWDKDLVITAYSTGGWAAGSKSYKLTFTYDSCKYDGGFFLLTDSNRMEILKNIKLLKGIKKGPSLDLFHDNPGKEVITIYSERTGYLHFDGDKAGEVDSASRERFRTAFYNLMGIAKVRNNK